MRIAEIFYSIQGEGKLLGMPSVFVRVSGCNLRCTWCDTPYASWKPDGPDMTVAQIVAEVLRLAEPTGPRYVVITGGEPMMFKDLVPLIDMLKGVGSHITVETAGTLWLEGLPVGGIDLASISPKLANSTPHERDGGRFAQTHERQRINLGPLREFATSGGGVIKDRQWKFVISSPQDLEEMQELLATINGDLDEPSQIAPEEILLMPEGTDAATLNERSRWLAALCKTHGYRLCPRLHVYLYGNTKGT